MKKPDMGRVNRVRELYSSGLSSRQVAALVCLSHGYVARLCADITRDRSSAAKLRQPRSTSKHWRTSRQNARRTMEDHLGRRLTSHEHVHHIDGDYTNNAISNLEILSPTEHAYRHHPRNPVPRHLRPARQAYMQVYLRAYRNRNK